MLWGNDCEFPGLVEGTFTLYHPPMIDEKKMYNFKSGGHASDFYQSHPPRKIMMGGQAYSAQAVPDLENNLHSCITSFFKQNKINNCFMNDILTPKGDGVVSIIQKGENYECRDSSGCKLLIADELLDFIKNVYLNWHFVCVGTYANTHSVRYSWEEIIKQEEKNINLIIISVYDGEGFIVWEKNYCCPVRTTDTRIFS